MPTIQDVDASIDMYKEFALSAALGSSFIAFRNEDRFVNAVYRSYNTGGLLQAWNANHIWILTPATAPTNPDWVSSEYGFERHSNLLSATFMASLGLQRIGYSVNLSDLGSSNKATVDVAKAFVARSVVNGAVQTLTLIGSYARFSDSAWSAVETNNAPALTSIKLLRAKVGMLASTTTSLNVIVALGFGGLALHIAEKSGNAGNIQSAKVAMAAQTANLVTNVSKAIHAYTQYRPTVYVRATQDAWGIAGSAAGVVQGLLSVGTMIPLMSKSGLTSEQSAILGAEMGNQLLGGILQSSSTIWLASRVAKGIAYGAAATGPATVALAGGLMLAMSPMQIYGLVQQSKYADRLAALGKTMEQYGYSGDTLLSKLYDKKVAVESTLMGIDTTLTILGAITEVAALLGSVSMGAGVIVAVATAVLSGILQGVTQPIIESIAHDYANKIQAQGGSMVYFGRELEAAHQMIITNSANQSALADLQTSYGVDQVIGVTSTKISQTALELASFTYNAAKLKTAQAYIDKFVGGKVVADQTLSLDMATGTVALPNPGAGKSQLLTFLTPLMAPGEEKRIRVKTGKNSYKTSLDIIFSGQGWTITDGDANSIMDVSNVVSKLYDANNQLQQDVALNIFGGNGDDTVIAGASKTFFYGGSGNNAMDYQRLDAGTSLHISYTPSMAGMGVVVDKSMNNVNGYAETVATASYQAGKRTETVQYRDIVVQQYTASTKDYLFNVSNITGSQGNDVIEGSLLDETFQGAGGNDSIYGNGGNDLLNGGAGNDYVSGGDGDDMIVQIIAHENDTLDGGSGVDTVDYSQSALPAPAAALPKGSYGIFAELRSNIVYKVSEGGPVWGIDTVTNIESVIGTNHDDRISGNTSDNALYGGLGNDWLAGWEGNDYLGGGAGNDTIWGGAGNDTIAAGAGSDAVLCDAGDDLVLQDIGAGNDAMNGGAGTDTLDYSVTTFANSPLAVRNGRGIEADLVQGWVNKWNGPDAAGYQGRDSVTGFENLTGSELADMITGTAGDNALNGGAGNDTLYGAAGADTINGGTGSDMLDGGAGNDSLSGGADADVLYGQDGDDTLFGDGGNDILYGAAGDDVLAGGAGADSIYGGDGDDIIVQDMDASVDFIDGGNGGDTVDYSATVFAADQLAKYPGQFGIIADLGTGSVQKKLGPVAANDILRNIENLIGSTGNDQITGDGNANVLLGDLGNDMIMGGAGDDLMNGGAGNDTIYGGDGNDTLAGAEGADLIYGAAGNDMILQRIDRVTDTINGGDGIDLVDYSGNSFTSDEMAAAPNGLGIFVEMQASIIYKRLDQSGKWWGVDFISGVESVKGTMLNDRLFGDANANGFDGSLGNDFIDGRGGDDELYGDWGDDSLYGGDGNDTLVGGAGSDIVDGGGGDDLVQQNLERVSDTLYGGAGTDTLDYSQDVYAGGMRADMPVGVGIFLDMASGQVEKYRGATVSGAAGVDFISGFEAAIGSNLNDVMMGDAGQNVLLGADGNDTIDGRDGDDYLEGNAGDDVLNGGAGDDQIGGGVGNDLLNGGAGNDLLSGGAGADTINGGDGDDTIAQSLENVNDVIDGGAGTDMLDYSGTEFSSAGRDLMGMVGIYADLAAGRVEKFHNLNGGIDSISKIENVIGTAFNDSIIGDDNANQLAGYTGNDTLVGGGGNDTLSGGPGADSLVGGDGDDVFQQDIDSYNDTIEGGPGVDTLDYSVTVFAPILAGNLGVSVSLPSNFALKMALSGAQGMDTLSGIENVFGSGLNDAIRGDGANNLLTGGDGADSIWGGAGDDVIMGDGGNDVIDGGAGNDTLAGAAGADLVSGGDGDDTIYQHLFRERDTIDGGNGSDTLDYSVSDLANIDRSGLGSQGITADLSIGRIDKYEIGSADGFDAVSGIENLVGTALDDSMIGSDDANFLSGGDGDDVLYGLSGDDILDGGAGHDYLDGGDGSDLYLFYDWSGADVINESPQTGAALDDVDVVNFDGAITPANLWFAQVGNDLQVTAVGTTASVTITDWYANVPSHIEQFRAANQVLLDSDVDNLVNAMAVYGAPAAGQSGIPAAMLAALNPVIQANWRALT